MCHSECLSQSTGDRWYSCRTQLSGTYAWGKLEKGQGYQPWASPSQIFGPEQVSKGQINSDPPLDQEKGPSAFLPEAPSIPSCTAHPACLTRLKSGKEVRPAEQDMGRGEGGLYTQTAIWSVKGGPGRGLDGQRLVSRKGSRSLYRV